MNNRIIVQNDPVNSIDPEGLSSFVFFSRPWYANFPKNIRLPRVIQKLPKPPGWTKKWNFRYPEARGGKSKRWFDPKGGEWRWHKPDKWHKEGHWDYNPWDAWNSAWRNIDIYGKPMEGIIPPIIDDSPKSKDPCDSAPADDEWI